MCRGKGSALRTSYIILKRVPAHERKSISRNLFTFGPMLIGIFCLIEGGEYPETVCDIGFETLCKCINKGLQKKSELQQIGT
jgi:hypothetical protein